MTYPSLVPASIPTLLDIQLPKPYHYPKDNLDQELVEKPTQKPCPTTKPTFYPTLIEKPTPTYGAVPFRSQFLDISCWFLVNCVKKSTEKKITFKYIFMVVINLCPD
jgi:hypothetical protein